MNEIRLQNAAFKEIDSNKNNQPFFVHKSLVSEKWMDFAIKDISWFIQVIINDSNYLLSLVI